MSEGSIKKNCKFCNKEFYNRHKGSVFCSISCSANYRHQKQGFNPMKGVVGEKNPNWKGGRNIDLNGYANVWTGGYKYEKEHRLVMEKVVGRKLNHNEHIHHRNGIRTDNRPENLDILVVNGIHAGSVLCPYCRKEFKIR